MYYMTIMSAYFFALAVIGTSTHMWSMSLINFVLSVITGAITYCAIFDQDL
jgi:hypothetical protein